MLFIFVIFLLCTTVKSGSRVKEGDSCTTERYQGVCKHLSSCKIVNDKLVAGEELEGFCGYINHELIVCCPPNSNTLPGDDFISTRLKEDLPTIDTGPSSTSKPPTIRPLTTPTSRPTILRPSHTRPNTVFNFGSLNPLAIPTPGDKAAQKCSEYAKAVYTLIPSTTPGFKPENVSLCGLGSNPTLIVGGTKAEARKFPHMAAIGYNARHLEIQWLCGGTLISQKYVLTAAHCLNNYWGAAVWVRLGEQNLKRDDDGARPQNFQVIERIKHPLYKKSMNYDDIGLLKIEDGVKFNAWIRPACLPIEADNYKLAVATGWGREDWSNQGGSNDLQEVTLPLVSNEKCNPFYKDDEYSLNRGIDPETQICAGEEGKDTCQGDSGGPLAIFNKKHYCMYDVVGVTSVGRSCANISPGVYTNVLAYLPWIERIVWP